MVRRSAHACVLGLRRRFMASERLSAGVHVLFEPLNVWHSAARMAARMRLDASARATARFSGPLRGRLCDCLARPRVRARRAQA